MTLKLWMMKTLELKKKIESFNKNNIDWVKIRETGELKYTDEIRYGRNVIDYGEAIQLITTIASFILQK